MLDYPAGAYIFILIFLNPPMEKEVITNKKILAIPAIAIVVVSLIGGIIYFSDSGTEEFDSFTIIVLPDTQKYSQDYPEIFTSQTQWIVDNEEDLNIQFVIHEGDIVEDSDKIKQWENANVSLSILDENNIPYSVIRGNHDKGTEIYKEYFPASRFSDKSWWGGEYKNNTNNYQLLTIQDNDFLFLSLDFCPDSEEINWADEILTQYSDKKTILTTHAYLDAGAERNPHVCGNTEYIWQMAKKHENLQIVLSGHVHTEARRTDNNQAGKPVYQMLADYQNEDNERSGYLRILKFVPDENKIYVKTYSPYTKKYQTDENSEFVLDYEF